MVFVTSIPLTLFLPCYCRLFTGVLRRSFEIEDIKYMRMSMARNDKRNLCALIDLDQATGMIIMDNLETAGLPQGVSLKHCTQLPQLVSERSDSYGGGGGGYGGRGGDRSVGGGGGGRGGYSDRGRSSGGGRSYGGDRERATTTWSPRSSSPGGSGPAKTWP